MGGTFDRAEATLIFQVIRHMSDFLFMPYAASHVMHVGVFPAFDFGIFHSTWNVRYFIYVFVLEPLARCRIFFSTLPLQTLLLVISFFIKGVRFLQAERYMYVNIKWS